MRDRADAGAAHRGLALVGFGISDDIVEVVQRQRLARHQHHRRSGDQNHRREITARIVRQLRIHAEACGVRPEIAHDHGVTVRIGAGGARRADRAAGAGNVLDHHLLAEHRADRL
jgi:hypothetical protein